MSSSPPRPLRGVPCVEVTVPPRYPLRAKAPTVASICRWRDMDLDISPAPGRPDAPVSAMGDRRPPARAWRRRRRRLPRRRTGLCDRRARGRVIVFPTVVRRSPALPVTLTSVRALAQRRSCRNAASAIPAKPRTFLRFLTILQRLRALARALRCDATRVHLLVGGGPWPRFPRHFRDGASASSGRALSRRPSPAAVHRRETCTRPSPQRRRSRNRAYSGAGSRRASAAYDAPCFQSR